MIFPDTKATRIAYAMGAQRAVSIVLDADNQGRKVGPELLRLNREMAKFGVAALDAARA